MPQNWTLTSIRVGEHDLTTSPDCLPDGNEEKTSTCVPEYISIKIERSTIHEKFNSGSRGYDLGLIKLSQNIPFNVLIQPICISKGVPLPQKFHVSGWGKVGGTKGSDLKLRSYLSLEERRICKEVYRRENVFLADDQFCAGGEYEEQPCVSDSGGPLMGVERMEDGKHKMVVLGVLSMDSRFCKVRGWPGIFTDVQNFRSWIQQHL